MIDKSLSAMIGTMTERVDRVVAEELYPPQRPLSPARALELNGTAKELAQMARALADRADNIAIALRRRREGSTPP